jgi:hypothetical protein
MLLACDLVLVLGWVVEADSAGVDIVMITRQKKKVLARERLGRRGEIKSRERKKQSKYIGSVTQYELVGDQEQLDWRC